MGSLAGASMRRGRGSVDRRNSLASSQQSHHPHDAVSPSVARRRRTDVWRVIRRCCQKFSTSTGVVVGWREPADLANPRHTYFLRATTEVTLEPASGQLFGPADRSRLDLVGIQDHPYQRRFLDTLALIETLLAETRRVRVFPDVANLPLRPPATLAKEAASLDVLSGGRFELGLGAGAFWDAIEAMGGP